MQSSVIRLRTLVLTLSSALVMLACAQLESNRNNGWAKDDASGQGGGGIQAGDTGGSNVGGTDDPSGVGGDEGTGGNDGSGGNGNGTGTDGGSGSGKGGSAGAGGAGQGGMPQTGGSGGRDAGAGGTAIPDAGKADGSTGTGGSGERPEGSCAPNQTVSFPVEAGAQPPQVTLPKTAFCIAVYGNFQGWGCPGADNRTITVNGQPITTCAMAGTPPKLSDGYRYFMVSAVFPDAQAYYYGSLNWY